VDVSSLGKARTCLGSAKVQTLRGDAPKIVKSMLNPALRESEMIDSAVDQICSWVSGVPPSPSRLRRTSRCQVSGQTSAESKSRFCSQGLKRNVEPGKSEPQNRRIMNRRMSKGGFALLSLLKNKFRNSEGWNRFRSS
jgi:hypothetical protein